MTQEKPELEERVAGLEDAVVEILERLPQEEVIEDPLHRGFMAFRKMRQPQRVALQSSSVKERS